MHTVKRSTVLGIPSPWSGDEHDKRPATYAPWFACYLLARRVRHALNLHDWRRSLAGMRCDWCGASRPVRKGD